MQYEVYEVSVEANGQAIRSVVDGVAEVSPVFERRALSILENNGISDPVPGQWYPMQNYLDAIRELEDTIGPKTVERVGRQIPKVVEWPDHIDSVPIALGQLDEVYQMNHRGGEIGYYEFKQTGERDGKMTCRNPYPCSLDTGLIIGTMDKFSPTGSFTRLTEDGRGREDGKSRCIYSVNW